MFLAFAFVCQAAAAPWLCADPYPATAAAATQRQTRQFGSHGGR